MSISVGDIAPDFRLSGTGKIEVALSNFRGEQNVLIVFYPADSTGG